MYTLDDVCSMDKLLERSLIAIIEAANQLTDKEFEAAYGDQRFVLDLSGDESDLVELCVGGKTKFLTK